jgi:hypothetical protein
MRFSKKVQNEVKIPIGTYNLFTCFFYFSIGILNWANQLLIVIIYLDTAPDIISKI